MKRKKKAGESFERTAMIAVAVLVIGVLGYYVSKSIEGSSASVLPGGPTVQVSLDSSSPLADLVIGGKRGVLDSVWRVVFEPSGPSTATAVNLAGITYTLDSDKKVVSRADVFNRAGNYRLATTQLAQSGDRLVLPFVFNPPLRLDPNKPVVLELKTNMYAVDGKAILNDTPYNIYIDSPKDVLIVSPAAGVRVVVDKNQMPPTNYLFETKPTFTLAPSSPSGSLIVGTNTLVAVYRVTADAGGDVTLVRGSSPHGEPAFIWGIDFFASDFKDTPEQLDPFDLTMWDFAGARQLSRYVSWHAWREYHKRILTYLDLADLIVPAGTHKDIAVRMNTMEFEDAGDKVTMYLPEEPSSIRWSIGGKGYYGHSDILFRGDIYAHTLVKQ